jgi:hypothetical protein
MIAEHNAKLKRQWDYQLNKKNELKNMEKGNGVVERVGS